jgi:uncharacterized membrane protein YfcA
MTPLALVGLGLTAGAGAGLLAGLIGIGGGIVVVPVVYYGLISTGVLPDDAAHIAISTSLAAILPAAIVSSLGHWRHGNTDLLFIREWGPGIALGVIAAQLSAPYVRGSLLIAMFATFCLIVALRFAAPSRFRPILPRPPSGSSRQIASFGIGLVSGFAGVGGGILTNIVMTLSGVPMHKSIGRAAAAGVVVGAPAMVVAAFGPTFGDPAQLGSINIPIWACIAPVQAVAAWIGAHLAQRISGDTLSRLFAAALALTGITMLRSSLF